MPSPYESLLALLQPAPRAPMPSLPDPIMPPSVGQQGMAMGQAFAKLKKPEPPQQQAGAPTPLAVPPWMRDAIGGMTPEEIIKLKHRMQAVLQGSVPPPSGAGGSTGASTFPPYTLPGLY